MSAEPPANELAARATAAAFARGDGVSNEAYQSLRSHLSGFVGREFPAFDVDFRWDVVDAAIEKFLRACRQGRVRPVTALAYLRQVVRNTGLDRVRSSRGDQSLDVLDGVADGDDAVARLVDAHADARTVEAILADAARNGDHIATRVINAYLNLAELLGSAPSNRTVATEAGVSHTTVQKVLNKLKAQLSGN